MKRIGIFGTSGMAREAGDLARELGMEPLYIGRFAQDMQSLSVKDEGIVETDLPSHTDMGFVIGIGDPSIRKALTQIHKGLHFVNLIHPSATFGASDGRWLEDRRGLIIAAGVRFSHSARAYDFCIVDFNATVHHDSILGEHCFVAAGAHIAGNVHIGAGCWIGSGAVITQGHPDQARCIGDGAIIGAGTVVLHDCDPQATYAGVPARRIP